MEMDDYQILFINLTAVVNSDKCDRTWMALKENVLLFYSLATNKKLKMKCRCALQTNNNKKTTTEASTEK